MLNVRSVTVGFWLLVASVASVGVTKSVLSDTLDPDLFWHLRVAEQLRTQGIGPIVDTLSFASTREPWTPYSWLAELFMEWLWRTFGWRSALVVEALASAAIVALIAMCCLELAGRQRRMSGAMATAVGAFFTVPYLAFRPITFAIALLGACAWLLLRDRRLEQRSRAVWLIVPLTALCTNVHLAAVVAPAWVACLFAGAGATWERRSMQRYGALLVTTALAALATPMLPGAVRTGWHYLSGDVMVAAGGIAEMRPIGPALAALTAAIFFVALLNRRALGVGEWLWLILAAGMMVRMSRFAPMFAFIAAPVLAATMPRMRDGVLGLRVVRAMLAVTLLVSLVRVAVGFPWTTPMGQWVNRHGPHYPVAAADYVDRSGMAGGRVMNEFNWGGYLAWRLGDRYQVFVDGRTQLYDERFWRATYLGSEGGDIVTAIKAARADVAILPKRGSRFRPALEQLGWKSIYSDEVAEVLAPPAP